jgi:PAS domain S-box-containing protein
VIPADAYPSAGGSADAHRWTMLFEQSPQSLQIFSPEGRSLKVNAAWRRLFGLTAEQAAEFNILQDSQLAAAGLTDHLDAAFAGDVVQMPPVPYVVQRAARAEVRWISAVFFPVVDDQGTLREVVCLHDDQTERRHAEDTIRESQQLLDSITRNVSEGIYRSTPDGRLSFVNDAYLKLFGYPSLDALNSFPREHLYARPADRARLLDLLHRHGGFRQEEIEFRRANGSTFWGLISSRAHRDPDSSRIAWMDGVISDVSERRIANQAIRDLNTHLEERVLDRTRELADANRSLHREIAQRQRREATLQAVWLISEAVHQSPDLDHFYARIHEIIAGLMPARNFYLILRDRETGLDHAVYWRDDMDPPPPPRRLRRGMTAYVLRTGQLLRATREEMLRPAPPGLDEATGDTWYCEMGTPSAVWLGLPLRLDREVIGAMVVQDYHNPDAYGPDAQQILTFVAEQVALAIQRKRAEAELLHSLESERQLGQLRQSFVSMVSHEFRTPLGIIASSAGLLDRHLDRLEPGERREHLASIRENTRRMARLMEEVLFFGRIEEGRLACSPQPLDLPTLCHRIADETLSATDQRCPIHVQIHVPPAAPDHPAPVLLDERLLRPILNNLLTNASKYSHPGSPVDLTLEVTADHVQFAVRDRGFGIPPEDLPNLFEPFRRGSNVQHLPGTGLGLAIVRRCVRLHGGQLDLSSEPNLGTTVTVRFPRATSPLPSSHSHLNPPHP